MAKLKTSKNYILYAALGSLIGLWLFTPIIYYSVFSQPDSSAQFVKTCYELNGMNYKYENIKKLNGYILLGYNSNGMNSHKYFPLEKQYLDNLAKGEYIDHVYDQKKAYNKKMIVINNNGEIMLAEDKNLDGHWVCYISPSVRISKINSRAEFTPAD